MALGEGRRSRVLCESPEVFHLQSIPAEIIIKTKSVALSLGADNITRGFHSTQIGFTAISIFMVIYYHFGRYAPKVENFRAFTKHP